MEKATLTAKEAANYLGVSLDLIYKYSTYGNLPCIRVGKRKLFRTESLNRWMDNQEIKCINN